MNREIQITIIACAIIFSGVGFLAFETIQDKPVSKPLVEKIALVPEVLDDIKTKNNTEKINDLIESLAKSPKVTSIKIDDNLILEKTITNMIIPENNVFPWGIIKGNVENPALGYPIIIQFFKSLDESPVHVAQINLDENNSFEYKFRLLSIDDGITTHFYEGDYFIKIFKTVNKLK